MGLVVESHGRLATYKLPTSEGLWLDEGNVGVGSRRSRGGPENLQHFGRSKFPRASEAPELCWISAAISLISKKGFLIWFKKVHCLLKGLLEAFVFLTFLEAA